MRVQQRELHHLLDLLQFFVHPAQVGVGALILRALLVLLAVHLTISVELGLGAGYTMLRRVKLHYLELHAV